MSEQPKDSKQISQEEEEKSWNQFWEVYINIAKMNAVNYDLDFQCGRYVVETCIGYLEGKEDEYLLLPSPWPKQRGYVPEPLASYLAEILKAALNAPAKEVSRAMHITRPNNRAKSEPSQPHKWCRARLREIVRKAGLNNVPKNKELANEIVKALEIETTFGADESTVQRWVKDDLAYVKIVVRLENSGEELSNYHKNHPLYKIE